MWAQLVLILNSSLVALAVAGYFPSVAAPKDLFLLRHRAVGAAAAVYAQFCYMARASSVGGAREYNPDGSLNSDISFTDAGMTYVLRFLKGWSPSTTVHGIRLPIAFAGPNTFPW